MTLFTFKDEHLRAEWPRVWSPLRHAFYRFCEQCATELDSPSAIITCLTRTPQENAAVGGKPNSLHMANPCRAIDIRRGGFEEYADQMKMLWQAIGPGWDFVIEGPPYNAKAPHFHLECEWSVTVWP